MNKTIGTCSICGGAVKLPEAWMSVNEPIPTCSQCGAKAKQPNGPTIQMERPLPSGVRITNTPVNFDL